MGCLYPPGSQLWSLGRDCASRSHKASFHRPSHRFHPWTLASVWRRIRVTRRQGSRLPSCTTSTAPANHWRSRSCATGPTLESPSCGPSTEWTRAYRSQRSPLLADSQTHVCSSTCSSDLVAHWSWICLGLGGIGHLHRLFLRKLSNFQAWKPCFFYRLLCTQDSQTAWNQVWKFTGMAWRGLFLRDSPWAPRCRHCLSWGGGRRGILSYGAPCQTRASFTESFPYLKGSSASSYCSFW